MYVFVTTGKYGSQSESLYAHAKVWNMTCSTRALVQRDPEKGAHQKVRSRRGCPVCATFAAKHSTSKIYFQFQTPTTQPSYPWTVTLRLLAQAPLLLCCTVISLNPSPTSPCSGTCFVSNLSENYPLSREWGLRRVAGYWRGQKFV